MKRRALTFLAATAAAAGALTTTQAQAGPAETHNYKAKTAKLDGAKATCDLVTWGALQDHARLTCKVKDTEADGYQPYVVWRQDGFGEVDFGYNSEGAGHTITASDARVNLDAGFQKIWFRTCMTTLGWDDCSNEKSWKVKR
ncbi:hypothetical protein [Streptomyces cavernicola]|uniref:Uncharacterized protein n=1 Tax=Streptomyces cavernicola TaxID=3043613 RepID=A0ABT6SH28_9ACTN|nr:hypothetical protein [Streptomyces sp. B-S-A6]MDI3406972.1 hypothetical protein [Streptomyces sp. B-S-A6]